MRPTNEDIEKAIHAIAYDHCSLCFDECDDDTGECPYLIARIALQLILSAREHEKEESEEGGAK